MLRATPILIAIVALTACGSSRSPEDEVMAVEIKGVEALTSDHPERMCGYVADRDKCVEGIVTAKALNLDVKGITGIPDDWRERLKKARVVIHGDRATLAPGPTGKTARFVRRDGRWLVEN